MATAEPVWAAKAHMHGLAYGLLPAGLGLFEYMLLAEVLEADPVWVVNAGISHQEDTPTSQIGPWFRCFLAWLRLTQSMKHSKLSSSCKP